MKIDLPVPWIVCRHCLPNNLQNNVKSIILTSSSDERIEGLQYLQIKYTKTKSKTTHLWVQVKEVQNDFFAQFPDRRRRVVDS